MNFEAIEVSGNFIMTFIGFRTYLKPWFTLLLFSRQYLVQLEKDFSCLFFHSFPNERNMRLKTFITHFSVP